MYVFIYILCAFVYLLISLFIYILIYSLSHCQVGQVGLLKRKGLGYWKTSTSSYQLSLLQW